jgi:hypothetical protein
MRELQQSKKNAGNDCENCQHSDVMVNTPIVHHNRNSFMLLPQTAAGGGGEAQVHECVS